MDDLISRQAAIDALQGRKRGAKMMKYSQSIIVKSDFTCVYLTPQDISKYNMVLDPHRYRFEATISKLTNLYHPQYCNRILDFETAHALVEKILPRKTYIYCSWSEGCDKDIGNILAEHGCSVLKIKDMVCAESICNFISQQLEQRFNKLADDNDVYKDIHLVHSILREDSNNYVTWDNQSLEN